MARSVFGGGGGIPDDIFVFEIHVDVFVSCFSSKKYKIHFHVGYISSVEWLFNAGGQIMDSSLKWTVRRIFTRATLC